MKTVVSKQSTDGVSVYKMTPTVSRSLINSVVHSSSLYPERQCFSYTLVCIHAFTLSYLFLMLRATLCAVVGLLNHNQLNLGHICVCVCVTTGGGRYSTKDLGGTSDTKFFLE